MLNAADPGRRQLRHLVAQIGRIGLVELPLGLRRDGVEDKGGLSAPLHPGEDIDAVFRDGQGQMFQIVLGHILQINRVVVPHGFPPESAFFFLN